MIPDKTIERFWGKVQVLGELECWPWMGGKQPSGYGAFHYNGDGFKIRSAHRFSWFLKHSRNPGKLVVRHSCDNPTCVNPNHLLIGTNLDNAKDLQRRRNTSRHIRERFPARMVFFMSQDLRIKCRVAAFSKGETLNGWFLKAVNAALKKDAK